MTIKITVDAQACNGCGECVEACLRQLGERPSNVQERLSRVKVLGQDPLFWLAICRQCAQAPCADACITGALKMDMISERVELDEHACIGCGMCVMVCPFGAMWLDDMRGKSVKCDLCPTRAVLPCVSACRPGALGTISSLVLSSNRRRATTQAKLVRGRKTMDLGHRSPRDASQ
jgi:carbon-monoxide dehydrogenase iron sulfur subunit